MTQYFDLKALGYGVATFMLGVLALMIAGTVAANSVPSIARVVLGGMQAGVSLIPAFAGYVSARRASSMPILHGTLAGALGTAVYLCVTVYLFPYPTRQIPMIVAVYALIAALGAIFGKHRRDRSSR